MSEKLWVIDVSKKHADRYSVVSTAYALSHLEALLVSHVLTSDMIGLGNDVVVRVWSKEHDE